MPDSIEIEIVEKLGFTQEEFEKRQKFILLGDRDIALLKEISLFMEDMPDDLFDDFYEHLLSFEETRAILKSDVVVERLKRKQKEYFKAMVSGTYDYQYMLDRLKVGYRHVEFGIVPMWYIGSFNKYLDGIRAYIKSKCACELGKYVEYMSALQKIAMLDIVLTLESYHYGRYKMQEVLEKQVVTDELTGVPNRRRFDQDIMNLIGHFERYQHPFSLIAIDLDNFKAINDTHGHDIGDMVLKVFCEIAQESLREVDSLYRYGGEEFNILLSSQHVASGEVVAERIRSAVAQHDFPTVGQVTASFGVTEYGVTDSQISFVKRADSALYEAKKRGKNRVVLG